MTKKALKMVSTVAICVICASVMIGSLWTARCAVTPVIDLPALVNGSDVIGVARVTINSGAAPLSVAVDLNFLGILKGSGTPSNLSLTISGNGPTGGWGPSRVGSTRVVFLKYSDNQLTVANSFYPSLPAVPDAVSPTSDPLGAVFEEEGAVLESLATSLSEKEEAISILGTCRDPRAKVALRAGLTASSPTVRMEAISRLAMLGEPDGVSLAIDALGAPPSNVPDNVIHNLDVGIRDGARSEAFAPQLAGLLSVNNAETREAAVESLMQIASPSSTPALFRALSDDDKKVRYFAVVGLAKIKGDREHRPNLEQFLKNEEPYTGYWRRQQ